MVSNSNNVCEWFLQFNSIADLLRKVDNIKKAHKAKSEIFRQKLTERGIKFDPIDDYSVIIDAKYLSNEDMLFIKNQDRSLIHEAYDENGVVSKHKLKGI